jgi:hypothetical protein
MASMAILAFVYTPAWSGRSLWTRSNNVARSRWLGDELAFGALRTSAILFLAWAVAAASARAPTAPLRRRLAWVLPILILADLLGAHYSDLPTITPRYWTDPPESARRLKADPGFGRLYSIRNYSIPGRSAAEPGYASEPVDFLSVRDTLDWSLPPVWGLSSSRGETPLFPRRVLEFADHLKPGDGQFDVASVTHLVTAFPVLQGWGRGKPAGSAFLHRNKGALPRTRLMGRPVYAAGEEAAIASLDRLGASARDRLVVEDPTRPLAAEALASGNATITRDLPEHVVVRTDSPGPAYLVLADTYDPGWTATVDGRPAPIRPAFVAFRAVFLTRGPHTVVFRYRPAGFALGLGISGFGLLISLGLLLGGHKVAGLLPEHGDSGWRPGWPLAAIGALGLIVLLSAFSIGPGAGLTLHPRWARSSHRFTWGSGVEAMHRAHGDGQRGFGPPRP